MDVNKLNKTQRRALKAVRRFKALCEAGGEFSYSDLSKEMKVTPLLFGGLINAGIAVNTGSRKYPKYVWQAGDITPQLFKKIEEGRSKKKYTTKETEELNLLNRLREVKSKTDNREKLIEEVTFINVLVKGGILVESSTEEVYQWNTIRPNIHMARELKKRLDSVSKTEENTQTKNTQKKNKGAMIKPKYAEIKLFWGLITIKAKLIY